MNLTAAMVTAATVTVYFVGLVHFQTNTAGYDVIVPLATATDVTHSGYGLAAHRADLEVTDYSSCPPANVVDGTTATPPGPKICRIANLNRATITLPTTTSTTSTAVATDTTFARIPRLRGLCATVGELRDEYKSGGTRVAARLRLDRGSLRGSINGRAWIGALDIDNPGNLLVTTPSGTTTVGLTDSATIWIKNQPTVASTTAEEKSHFLWYYTMYENTSTCDKLPTGTMAHTHSDYGTGVGCSNTQYP